MVKARTNPLADMPVPLGTLMAACAHRLSAELDRALAEAGFSDIGSAQSGIFMGIDPHGTRLTDLATRLRLSKQAVGEQVRSLTERGYVEVVPDPADGRARLVRLTAGGWRAVQVAADVITEFHAWMRSVVGDDGEQELRGMLAKILDSDRQSWGGNPSS